MKPARIFAFTCPSCGFEGNRFPFIRTLDRKLKTKCRECGKAIESDASIWVYMAASIYTTAVASILGFILITCLITGRWLSALIAGLAIAALIFPLNAAIHARNAVLSEDLHRKGHYHQ